jgi:hypothetical protein
MCQSQTVQQASGVGKTPVARSSWLKNGTAFRAVAANVMGLLVALLFVYGHPSVSSGNESLTEILCDVAILGVGVIAWYHFSKARCLKASACRSTMSASSVGAMRGTVCIDPFRRRMQVPAEPAQREPAQRVKAVRTSPVKLQRQTVSFLAGGWEAEIADLLHRITPTRACTDVALQLAASSRALISTIIPEAEINCFPNVRLVGNTDVGTLEVDLAISVPFDTLAQRLETFSLNRCLGDRHGQLNRKIITTLTPEEVARTALQTLTKVLIKRVPGPVDALFQFHHCSYRGDEPKVVLRFRAAHGLSDRDISVNVHVNCPTPHNVAAVMEQCRHHDRRFAELVMLVRRWARDRGIAYEAKGHLSPYAWTVLTVFFLQRHSAEKANDVPSLPRSSSGLVDGVAAAIEHESVASLLRAFLRFYGNDFDWKAGSISALFGCIKECRSASETLVSITDPFDSARDLGASLSEVGLMRLREEFHRANMLLDDVSTGLKKLLEPWMPTAES